MNPRVTPTWADEMAELDVVNGDKEMVALLICYVVQILVNCLKGKVSGKGKGGKGLGENLR